MARVVIRLEKTIKLVFSLSCRAWRLLITKKSNQEETVNSPTRDFFFSLGKNGEIESISLNYIELTRILSGHLYSEAVAPRSPFPWSQQVIFYYPQCL